MPKVVKPLTDTGIGSLKKAAKAYSKFDGNGLHLVVTPTGGKLWRIKYSFNGKARLLSLGAYPYISLHDARQRLYELKKQLALGLDPLLLVSEKDVTDTFKEVALEWFSRFSLRWSEGHREKVLRGLEKDTFPMIGNQPISKISAPDLLKVLRKVEARAPETAHRLCWTCGKIFSFAISTGIAGVDRNPASDLQGALAPFVRNHFPAIVDPAKLAPLLRDIDEYKGGILTQAALKLLPLLMLRPGNLRSLEWSEIDFELKKIEIPAAKMKTSSDHTVPLARQAVEILGELKKITGYYKYVFPSARSDEKPMSAGTFNAAFRRMGYGQEVVTAHGFRATARTMQDEILGVRVDFSEHQLAHAVKDATGRAYNRTAHLPARHEMMQQWADYLDKLKDSKE